MTAEARTHFVYRVYDEFDQLIYIGCTKDRVRRWSQHRANNTAWVAFSRSARLVGPFEKRKAFALESTLIEAEKPFFNALRSHKVSVRRNWQERDRRIKALRLTEPHLFLSEAFPRFCERMDSIDREVDESFPAIGAEWRLKNYLNSRRLKAVKPA